MQKFRNFTESVHQIFPKFYLLKGIQKEQLRLCPKETSLDFFGTQN